MELVGPVNKEESELNYLDGIKIRATIVYME